MFSQFRNVVENLTHTVPNINSSSPPVMSGDSHQPHRSTSVESAISPQHSVSQSPITQEDISSVSRVRPKLTLEERLKAKFEEERAGSITSSVGQQAFLVDPIMIPLPPSPPYSTSQIKEGVANESISIENHSFSNMESLATEELDPLSRFHIVDSGELNPHEKLSSLSESLLGESRDAIPAEFAHLQLTHATLHSSSSDVQNLDVEHLREQLKSLEKKFTG